MKQGPGQYRAPAAAGQRQPRYENRKTSPRAILNRTPREPEPFGPAYGCVEWFDYEERTLPRRAAAG